MPSKNQKLNYTAKIAQVFVNNGRLSLLLVIGLFVWGIIAFKQTAKQYNPKITAPAFRIVVNFAGASKNEVLEQVTKPLENVVSEIAGVEDIFTTTSEGGRLEMVVNFYVGEDVDSAKITLTDRIESNFDIAPLGISQPLIQSIDPDDVPVFAIALSSQEKTPIELRKYAFKVRDQLLNIEGTSAIEIIGGSRRELAIDIDPNRLARYNVGIADIESALKNNNVYLPTGYVKGKDTYTQIEARGTVSKPSELENIVIASNDLSDLRLRTIAKVVEKETEDEYIVRQRIGKSGFANSVFLSFAKLKDTNISDVTETLEAKVDELKAQLQADKIEARTIINEGAVASKEINRLVINLITAIAIVVLILLIFLDLRAAILVAIAIPLTLLSVFGIALISGQNINRITLFALILSLGLLVDNATVVIENIVRHLRDSKKKNKNEVVIVAVSEVGPGLTMSTITTVLAFVPMAFVTGMMGPYMGPIPFFVPMALVVSLFLAFSINPWLATVMLKPGATAPGGLKEKLSGYLSPMRNLAAALFAKFQLYFRSLLENQKKRRNFLLFILAALLLSFVLPAVGLVKFRMLPKADREQFYVYLDMPAATSLAKTSTTVTAIENFLLQNDHIEAVQSYIGTPPILDFNGLFRGVVNRRQSHQATLRVALTDPENRDIESASIVLNLRPQLLEFTKNLEKESVIKLVEDPPGPPVLSTLLVRVQAYHEELLPPIIADLQQKISKFDQVVDVDTSIEEDSETITLAIDQARATKSRISSQQIINALSTAYQGKIVGLYHNRTNLEQEYIRLRLAPKHRQDRRALKQIYLKNSLGIMVSLQNFVSFKKKAAIKPLLRENRRTTAYIYGDMGDRSITYSAIDILSLLTDYQPAPGSERTGFSLFGASYQLKSGEKIDISIGGEWQLTLEVFADLGAAMGVAILLIYFVLVAQFSSFRDALIVMATIPLSLIGVLPGFLLLYYTNGLYFNATSMIGVIALAGIAVNNSIILLEYLNSLKTQKANLIEALFQAGLTRFRPIMLTTITTILGSLTIAGDPVWAGLAFAIVMGLAISSILTILVFPALYMVLKSKTWP